MQPYTVYFEDLLERFIEFLPTLALGLVIFLISYLLSRWASRLVRRGVERRAHDRELIVLLDILTRWGIVTIGIVLALNVIAPGRFGSLIAGLGVVGITIGFALQDVAKNFIAGVLLLLQRPFSLDDMIEVAGYTGKVAGITLRTTEILTVDGRYVLIPNGDVYTQSIVNLTRGPRRRVEVVLGVAYETDLDLAARLALDALQGLRGSLREPAPQVGFTAFGQAAIELTAHYWVETRSADMFEMTNVGVKALKAAFESAGIQFFSPTVLIQAENNPQR